MKDVLFVELDATVQGCLATKSEQYAVGSFPFYELDYEFRSYRQEVNLDRAEFQMSLIANSGVTGKK